MKKDWDERARFNPYFVITTGFSNSDESFWSSGKKDCENILGTNSARFAEICDAEDPRQMRILEIGCGIGESKEMLEKYKEIANKEKA